jgi:hypothetical protein
LMRRARTASGTATQCTRTNDLFHEQERTYMHTKRVCPHCAEALPAMGAGGCVFPFVCFLFENRNAGESQSDRTTSMSLAQ